MKKKITLATIAITIMACLLLCACGSKSINTSKEKTTETAKEAIITVTIQNDLLEPRMDITEEYQTSCKTLGDFVRTSNLFVWESGPYGTVIRGISGAAEVDADNVFWMFKVNGVDSEVGSDEVEIHDGDEFVFYTIVY